MLGKAVFQKDYKYECSVQQEKTDLNMSATYSDGFEPPTYFRMALVKCISAYILDLAHVGK